MQILLFQVAWYVNLETLSQYFLQWISELQICFCKFNRILFTEEISYLLIGETGASCHSGKCLYPSKVVSQKFS